MFGQFGPAHSFKQEQEDKISAYQAEDSDDKGASSQICAAKFLHRRNFHFGGGCEPERQKFYNSRKGFSQDYKLLYWRTAAVVWDAPGYS